MEQQKSHGAVFVVIGLIAGLAGGYFYGAYAGQKKERGLLAEQAKEEARAAERLAVEAANPFNTTENPLKDVTTNPFDKINVNPFDR